MGKFSQHEQSEVTIEAVEKAISSFRELRKSLAKDYMECIALANKLGKFQKDQNFDHFKKKLKPNQENINALSREMEDRAKYVEDHVLATLKVYGRQKIN